MKVGHCVARWRLTGPSSGETRTFPYSAVLHPLQMLLRQAIVKRPSAGGWTVSRKARWRRHSTPMASRRNTANGRPAARPEGAAQASRPGVATLGKGQPFPAGRALIRNAWVALKVALLSIVLVYPSLGPCIGLRCCPVSERWLDVHAAWPHATVGAPPRREGVHDGMKPRGTRIRKPAGICDDLKPPATRRTVHT